MSNYNLEEIKLIKSQMFLSILIIITILLSLDLSYNEILKLTKKIPLFSSKVEHKLLISNRILALLIAVAFLYINYVDKNIKQKYQKNNLNDANIQINASILTVIASLIVLYADLNNKNNETELENPEL